jgi:hypothetical protein
MQLRNLFGVRAPLKIRRHFVNPSPVSSLKKAVVSAESAVAHLAR